MNHFKEFQLFKLYATLTLIKLGNNLSTDRVWDLQTCPTSSIFRKVVILLLRINIRELALFAEIGTILAKIALQAIRGKFKGL